MAKRETILVNLGTEKAHHPGFAVCYARSSVFKPEGRRLVRVEKGKRTEVNRVLCLRKMFRGRCSRCPHSNFEVEFEAKGE